jgi:hypothetical protein
MRDHEQPLGNVATLGGLSFLGLGFSEVLEGHNNGLGFSHVAVKAVLFHGLVEALLKGNDGLQHFGQRETARLGFFHQFVKRRFVRGFKIEVNKLLGRLGKDATLAVAVPANRAKFLKPIDEGLNTAGLTQTLDQAVTVHGITVSGRMVHGLDGGRMVQFVTLDGVTNSVVNEGGQLASIDLVVDLGQRNKLTAGGPRDVDDDGLDGNRNSFGFGHCCFQTGD